MGYAGSPLLTCFAVFSPLTVCISIGYFQGAPLKGPRIVSHRLTLSYTSKICKQVRPEGPTTCSCPHRTTNTDTLLARLRPIHPGSSSRFPRRPTSRLSMTSETMTLKWTGAFCSLSSEHSRTQANRYVYVCMYDGSLAFIDGDSDPWRPATPQSDHAKKREDSILRPVKLIAGRFCRLLARACFRVGSLSDQVASLCRCRSP